MAAEVAGNAAEKVKAIAMQTTVYAVRTSLFQNWLRAELRSPQISAFDVI
ncbi:MAG: hypothetical protein ACXVDA_16995 [Ktedonobacterales bacterium]